MKLQWMGALLIMAACAGVGFSMARNYKRQLASLHHLIKALEYIRCELEYRLTPLPDLCVKAAEFTEGSLKAIFFALAEELQTQMQPDAGLCMEAALSRVTVPEKTADALKEFGRSLGHFDLNGQLMGVDGVLSSCRQQVGRMETDLPQRIRSYQTLGVCAGVALAILLV